MTDNKHCIFLGSYGKQLDLYDCTAPGFLCKSPIEVGCGYESDKIHKCSKLHRLQKWLDEVLNRK